MLIPISLKEANAYVAQYHSHHKPVVGHKFSSSAAIWNDKGEKERVGTVIVSRPVAQALDDGHTLEVTRLCCPGAHDNVATKNVASKLLGSATDALEAMGYRLGISYTRKDEDGTCYKAAGWVPVAEVKGQPWTHGNKSTRWLPGFYEPSTEIVDRIRWEWRPPWHIRLICKMVFALGEWARAVERKTRRAA